MHDIDTLLSLRGQNVIDREGSKIGTFEELYVDDTTGEPEWALVNTGLFGTKSTFVPLEGAQPEGDALRVAFTKDKVKDAPRFDTDQHLDASQEDDLYGYYGVGRAQQAGTADRGTMDRGTVGHDTSGPETDDAMTRSEEELQVGTTEREAGRARLRKYVVTDEVETTVPVEREEVRIEREPITDANVDEATEGPAISEEEHEVVLHEEEPVVSKEAVPKERVRLEKDTTTEERRVDEEVRREEITLDEDADTRR